MLSIIISSYQPSFYKSLSESIEETCGIGYEIIKIENNNKYSLTEAYNLGALRAKFPNLLFLHEDVIFHTQNWGQKLIDLLEDETIGLVGLAGTNYLSTAPNNWWTDSEHDYKFMIQNDKSLVNGKKITTCSKEKQPAILLDGVFMACCAKDFQNVKFSEDVKGFHGYDVDFSLHFSKIKQNIVTNQILIEHFSGGTPDNKYLSNLIQIWKTEKKYIQKRQKENYNTKLESHIYRNFVSLYLQHNPLNLQTLKIFTRFLPKFNPMGYLRIIKFIVTKI